MAAKRDDEEQGTARNKAQASGPHGQSHGKPPTHASDDNSRAQPNPKVQASTSGQASPSHKSQIAQFFRSQGRQDDDVVFSVGGMDLRLRDLE